MQKESQSEPLAQSFTMIWSGSAMFLVQAYRLIPLWNKVEEVWNFLRVPIVAKGKSERLQILA